MASGIKLGKRARTSVGGLVVVKEQIVTSVLVGFPANRISAGQRFLPNHIHNIRKLFSGRRIEDDHFCGSYAWNVLVLDLY